MLVPLKSWILHARNPIDIFRKNRRTKEATDRLEKLDMTIEQWPWADGFERKGMKTLQAALEKFIEMGVVGELTEVTYDDFVETVKNYYRLLDKLKEIDQTTIVLDKKPSSTLRFAVNKINTVIVPI